MPKCPVATAVTGLCVQHFLDLGRHLVGGDLEGVRKVLSAQLVARQDGAFGTMWCARVVGRGGVSAGYPVRGPRNRGRGEKAVAKPGLHSGIIALTKTDLSQPAMPRRRYRHGLGNGFIAASRDPDAQFLRGSVPTLQSLHQSETHLEEAVSQSC